MALLPDEWLAARCGRCRITLKPPPVTPAYLLKSLASTQFSMTPCELELTDTTLRCTLKAYSSWVEKALGLTDLKQRLHSGQSMPAFEFGRDHLDVSWYKFWLYGFGFQVGAGDSRRWVISLVRPDSTIAALKDIIGSRQARNQWREALSADVDR